MGKAGMCLEPLDRMLACAEPQLADGSFAWSCEGLPWPLGDASEVCCPCAGYSCSVWSEARVGAAVACQQPVVGAGQGCCQEPAPPAAVPGGGCLRWAGSGSCRGRSGSSSSSSSNNSSSSGSGWPSGLRRCIQVAVSLGGVGSTPTPDRLLSLLASFPLLTAGFLLLWGLCSALAAVPASLQKEKGAYLCCPTSTSWVGLQEKQGGRAPGEFHLSTLPCKTHILHAPPRISVRISGHSSNICSHNPLSLQQPFWLEGISGSQRGHPPASTGSHHLIFLSGHTIP